MNVDFEYLRQWLKDHKITREQFAQDIGVSIYDVNNWFARKPKRFSLKIAVRIAKAYQIPLEELVKFDDSPDIKITDPPLEKSIVEENGVLILKKPNATDQSEKDQTTRLPEYHIQSSFTYSEYQERTLLTHFDKLNNPGRDKAIEAVSLLSRIPDFQKKIIKDDPDNQGQK